MKTDQMSFDEKLARPIRPDTELREPLLWFQNLHLLRRLGDGDEPPNLIRGFTFRRGLNVLWAEPEDPETSEGLYGDGIAGHATGKTLFCRILRHLLAEPNYGTAELVEHVRNEFQELWAVATVRLARRSWVVGRPLAGPGADFAIEEGDVSEVFRTAPTFSGFKKFTDALENACGSPLSGMYPAEGWRNLLPWLARDQESRFSTVTAWRDSSSEADNPKNSTSARQLILRAVLRLLEKDEFDARQAIAAEEEKIKGWIQSLPSKTEVATRDLARAARTLKEIKGLDVDLIDLEAAKAKVVSQREIREEALEHFRRQPEGDEVTEARKQLQAAISRQASMADRIKTLDNEIPELQKQADNSLLTVRKIKRSGLRDPKRVSDGYCPNSYREALRRECVPRGPDDGDESMVEIAELEAQAEALATRVQAKRDEKSRLESQKDQLEAAVGEKRDELARALAEFPSPAIAIEREVTLLKSAEEELDDAIESSAAKAELDSKILQSQNRILEQKENLTHLKSLAERRLRSFSDIFGDIVRAVLGASITASAELGERTIHLRVKRSRELGGAAMESVKTIAFDLAAVVHAIEGNCDHPRFLIHDGPREADMARVIYERFFFYARRMESVFGSDQATFQYILTTTTNPPSDMREGSGWLLGEKLSGKTKDGRLLKEDF